MRPSALFPVLCALAALILSLLCLLAGTSRSFLQNADILTVNVSRLGHTSVFNTSDDDGSLISSIANDIEGEINDLISNATEDIAQALDLHDFYKAHVMNYCEGYYANSTNPGTSKNITYCSKRNGLFHFDLTAIIQEELGNSTNLTDIHWPDGIEDGIEALEVASKVMAVFYYIGIAFAALALLTALVGVFANGRISAFVNWIVDILAFLALGIASAISTVIAVKVTHVVNKYGADIGIAAYKGKTFLGMTWAATVVMLLASFLWLMECCAGRRRRTTYTEKHNTT
ncbi:putative integral membrane protein [Phaeomoniella chlamydospora]|uniref:Putative integral membrane protein n=1 Tax=Phaeomoniella chlamydospora TaxID=158046 RepID=A0A0G2EDF6_PHACM|nr:putative integral membrane protein [Phaeomoniella chlamydospora]